MVIENFQLYIRLTIEYGYPNIILRHYGILKNWIESILDNILSGK